MVKKLTKILSLVFLSIALYACDSGCVNEDEFDGYSFEVNSKPESTGIIGTYNSADGGQMANWQNTDLRSNGEQFIIQITGAWTPWYGSQMNDTSLNNLPKCSFCAKKSGVANCICYDNQTPEPELSSDGYTYVSTDCSIASNQNDPAKCTCTKQYGSATDYTAYHIPLNYMDKYENIKGADDQSTCKYYGGMGLYIGLFGRSGNDNPYRIYNLFSQTEVCDVVRNSNLECLDDKGRDVTKYIYRSAHNTIFVKDDNNGNNTDDDSNGTYHSPYEQVKLTINDGYYADNYGKYNVSFYKGVGSTNTSGILEYLVSLVEDSLMGKVGDDGKREGGVLRFMYQSIVQDSGFIQILQILLTMYISFYGLATLIGVASITTKDLLNRLIKFSLIIFFTSSDSWNWYNDIVVGLFKDGMDSVIGMIMNLSDQNLDSQTSSIIIAQMERVSDTSSATRFSYVDLTIEKLLSFAAAKKIFGLFFGTFFGFLYIIIIYLLIAYLIYVMLNAALVYVINLMKLVFMLALGPIFICFTLFAQTNGIFKKWLLFLTARSLEMVMMFLILYSFIVLINNQFVSMLYYKSCIESYNLYLFSLKIVKAETNRALMSWFSYFITIGGLIFMLQLVFDKVAHIAGYLISLNGEGNKDADNDVGRGQSSFSMAGKIMGNAFSFAESTVKSGLYNGAGVLAQAGDMVGSGVSRAANVVGGKILRTGLGQAVANSSVGKAIGAAYESMPSGPRTFYANRLIDAEIKNARSELQKSSPGLSGAELDLKVRAAVIKAMQTKMYRGENPKGKSTFDPSGMKIAGINTESVLKRLDEKLVQEPLKNFLKDTAAKLKSSEHAPVGAAMQDALKDAAKNWAAKNLAAGEAAITPHLSKHSMNSFIKKQAKFTTSQAAKAFGDSVEGQNRYLQHLKENEFIQQQKSDQAKKGIFYGKTHELGRAITKLYSRDVKNNPEVAREAFIRRLNKQQKKEEASQKYAQKLDVAKNYSLLARSAKNVKEYFNPMNVDFGNIRDRATGDFVLPNYVSKQSEQVRNASTSSTRENLKNISNEKHEIEKKYADKIDPKKGFVSGFDKREAEKEKQNSLNILSDKKEFFTNQLKKDALAKDDFAAKLKALENLGKSRNIASVEAAEKLRQQMLAESKIAVEKAKQDINKRVEDIKSLKDEVAKRNNDLEKYKDSFDKLKKEQQEQINNLTDKNKKEELSKQIEEDAKRYELIKKQEENLVEKLKSQLEEKVKSVGGEDLLKEGLAAINGTTLVEEQTRLDHLEKLAAKEKFDSLEKSDRLGDKFDSLQKDFAKHQEEETTLRNKRDDNQRNLDDLQKFGKGLSEDLERIAREKTSQLSEQEMKKLKAEEDAVKSGIETNKELKKAAEKKLAEYEKDLVKLKSKMDQSKKKLSVAEDKKSRKDLEHERKESVALNFEDKEIQRRGINDSIELQEKYKTTVLTYENVVSEIEKVYDEITMIGKAEDIDNKINMLEQSISVASKSKKQIEEEIAAEQLKYKEGSEKLEKMLSVEEIDKRLHMKKIDEIHNKHSKASVNPFEMEELKEELEKYTKANKGSEIYAAMSSEELKKTMQESDVNVRKQRDELVAISGKIKDLSDSQNEQQRIIDDSKIQVSVAQHSKESLKLKEEHNKNLSELRVLKRTMETLKTAEDGKTLSEKRQAVEAREKTAKMLLEAEEKTYKSQKLVEVDRQRTEINDQKIKLSSRLRDLSVTAEEYRNNSISNQESIALMQNSRLEQYEQFNNLMSDKSDPQNDVKASALGKEIFETDNKINVMMIDQGVNQRISKIATEEIFFENEKMKLLDFKEKTLGRETTLQEKHEEYQIKQNIQNYENIVENSKIELSSYRANIANGVIQEVSNIMNVGFDKNPETKEAVEEKAKHLSQALDALSKESEIQDKLNNKQSSENNDGKEGGDKKSSADEDKNKNKTADNYSMKSSLFADKMQVNAKSKLVHLNISLKQSELSRLKSIKPQDLTPFDIEKISSLEQEIADLQSKLAKQEEDSRNIDDRMISIDN